MLIDVFNQMRTGTGTHEWAEITFNIQSGCSNGCLYCYARAKALETGTIDIQSQWLTETINPRAVERQWRKREGVIMFPTTHDITRKNLSYVLTALKNILSAGNNVLIVSKPDPYCIKQLCKDLEVYKNQILFRFTIGSTDREICAFWEPNAPTPEERLEALKWAHQHKYRTSVSMEPMLGNVEMAVNTFRTVVPFVNDKVWIGKMNKVQKRIDMSNDVIRSAAEKIVNNQRDEEILRLYHTLNLEPKVRWKDSVKRILSKYRL